MSCKVLFLGAGASVDAGYPLCRDVFTFLEDYLKNNVVDNYKDWWKTFHEFRDKNEVFRALKDVEDFYTRLENVISQRGADLFEYKRVLESLSHMIDYRFGLYNGDYNDLKRKKKLQYIENMISTSDYIITLNWDNLCEFILSDMQLWFPNDGYGIPIKLKRIGSRRRINGIRPAPSDDSVEYPKSKVTVLKLHGSMGWRKTEEGIFFLRHYDFLKYIPGLKYRIFDVNEPADPGEDFLADSVMIFPSYNKQYNKHHELTLIWKMAKEILEKATEVEFVGYSLPEGDRGVRNLIKTLKNRKSNNEVHIKCIVGNRNNNTSKLYLDLLGDGIEIIQKDAKVYYTQNG